MHQGQSAESLLTHAGSEVRLQPTKNTNATFTLTASDWNCAYKTQKAMNVWKHGLTGKN